MLKLSVATDNRQNISGNLLNANYAARAISNLRCLKHENNMTNKCWKFE